MPQTEKIVINFVTSTATDRDILKALIVAEQKNNVSEYTLRMTIEIYPDHIAIETDTHRFLFWDS